ncbi:hypothetical protein IQ272_15720 [Chroococcidiopsidales cyanobacterium LEGE 13417]|nr:hypothetical protein [Chroococcidiopsidales cyanobacterium LEGE 13417]
MLQLDANMLELLAADPQKFQGDFIEPQFFPAPSNLVEDRKEIERFGLVLQQLLMGLPVEPLLQAYPKIAGWIDRVLPIASVPARTKQVNTWRQKLIQGALIIAHYDLLILGDQKAIVVNWRSDRNIPRSGQLENSWEAQLQLFLLTETEEILPNNVSLIYCFFDSGKYPTLNRFSYDREKYDAFKQRLEMALSNLPSNLIDDSDYSFHQPIDEAEINLQRLFDGEITAHEYLELISEVEI